VATLILPADVSWGDGAKPAAPAARPSPASVSAGAVERGHNVLSSSSRVAILLGGRALRGDALMAAGRIAAKTGAKLLAETFPTRLERGAGLPSVERLAYVPELASVQLSGLHHLILVDARAPVTFFAYPGLEGSLVPDSCQVHELAGPAADVLGSLEALVEAVGAGGADPALQAASRPARPTGELTAEKVCQAIGAVLPEGAIISDESNTSGLMLASLTAGAPPHDVLTITGGAIGQGLPAAVGAAVACPDRPVLALEAEGSAMYTIQSLWTMAREQLDVTVVIFNNRSYAILNVELQRVGASGSGEKAQSQLDLGQPDLDLVSLGKGMGVPSVRANSGAELLGELERAIAEPGPHLIEAPVPPTFSPAQLRVMPYALKGLGMLPRPIASAIKRRLYP
jgi:acetolactate synthase-1/2/3 large subunit